MLNDAGSVGKCTRSLFGLNESVGMVGIMLCDSVREMCAGMEKSGGSRTCAVSGEPRVRIFSCESVMVIGVGSVSLGSLLSLGFLGEGVGCCASFLFCLRFHIF